MSLTSYYLIGPIIPNTEVILTYSQGGIAYFLTLVGGGTATQGSEAFQSVPPDDLIFDPRATGDSNTVSDPLTLTVVSLESGKYGLTFTDSSNNLRYVAGITTRNDVIAGSSDKMTELVPTQTEAAPWPGIPFLAGIGYSFQTRAGKTVEWKTYVGQMGEEGVAQSIQMTNSQPVINTITDGIRIIPTNWLQRGTCAQIGSQQVTSVQATKNNEIFWVARLQGQFFDGFTNLQDCQTGVRYSYCPPMKMCSKNCRGPCPSTGATGSKGTQSTLPGSTGNDTRSTDPNIGCFFDKSTNGFKCEENPVDKPWWQQEWFIIGAIVVGLIIVILFVFLIFRFVH